ncbi:PAS domain S-box protein [Marinobacterium sp. AK62]|uniref:PAS domain S-box protein n=1 Tax=Marinobacterium alkalitolerans TaxID=1542925 RepID=A0ABS3ZCJ6_9GAMM|nr:methyl-accepting chemotaxis protein [Marinobacterium alkalitolerans]MBP0049428.1 PAS domain S-box protein [Marinobacterium alkalitolerans]
MKKNLPVTDNEVKLRDGQELVTITDLKGIITYTNPAFVEVSGFSRQELLGANHNIVRHPDMPPAAFKDLWDHLDAGRPWSRLVKNRCKNGDYYWVRANVTPIYRDGEVVEYMSVRVRPEQDEIDAAEALYRKLNKNERSLPPVSSIPERNLEAAMTRTTTLAIVAATLVALALWFAPVNPALVALGPALGMLMLMLGNSRTLKELALKPMQESIDRMRRVAEGDYYQDIPFDLPGEGGELLRMTKSLAIKLGFDVNDARLRQRRAQRIKVALDNVSSNVMVASNEGEIIYLNDSVLDMMRNAQDDLRQELPEFNAEQLMGANIDVFHKNPEHQRRLLASLEDSFKSRIRVGGRSFDLVANPVVDDNNNRLGTVVEWQDITEQLRAEHEIEQLIHNATEGQLDKRLDTEGYAGFTRTVANGVNALLDTVVEPLRDIKRVLSALSEGDLTQQMQGDYKGEFAELNNSLTRSLGRLENMVTEIRRAGSSIAVGASEIATGNTTLSERTESQAASLEETAASMEQMTSTVKQNADNAQQASRLAEEARTLAEQGGDISTRVVASMGAISTSSNKISEIIGVIDEIAFQTNLLALNAAVEAARAGEQGRGFAVVASEVRNLAQRSAGAAKEIKELISDSVSKVDEGARYVDESGEALKRIMDSINQVSDIIGQIAKAGIEQAQGIDQVNTAVSSMDAGTQQNAALVEEVAAASASMEEQASQLQRLVNAFRVNSTAQAQTEASDHAPVSRIRDLAAQTQAPEAQQRKLGVMTAGSSQDDWEEF